MNIEIDWSKSEGLVPAIVQDHKSGQVLMLGYMNPESYELTRKTGKVTFYSRSRQSLWTKGETSGNTLEVVEIRSDCDQDALLIRARPVGPTCHRGTATCFDADTGATAAAAVNGGAGHESIEFLSRLSGIISTRFKQRPQGSYVTGLINDGLDRMAQKVGEEAIETVIASKNSDLAEFEGEASDLLFHLMVLLEQKGSSLARLAALLEKRHR